MLIKLLKTVTNKYVLANNPKKQQKPIRDNTVITKTVNKAAISKPGVCPKQSQYNI